MMVAFGACTSSNDGKLPVVPSGTGGSSAGSGGTGGSSAGTGGSSAGTGGSSAGTGGSSAGTGGSTTGTGGSSSGSGGSMDASTSDVVAPTDTGGGETAVPGWAGIPGIENLSTPKPSPGCGMPASGGLGTWQSNNITITPKPVRGTGNRVYYVKLPASYTNTKPYRLVVGGSGCNGAGTDVPDFTGVAGADGVIHVALQIEQGVHIIESGVNCFDDKKTDSVEYAFLEQTLAAVRQKVCYDEHHVFVTGHSSGGWLSNQLGCVFGSKLVRAIAPSSGGLAAGAGVAPPCSDLPLPGIWTANADDTEAPGPTKDAVERALKVNKCTGGTTVTTAPRTPYMVPGNATNACEKFTGCPAEFPIVYCHPTSGAHAKNVWHEAAAWQFWKSLP